MSLILRISLLAAMIGGLIGFGANGNALAAALYPATEGLVGGYDHFWDNEDPMTELAGETTVKVLSWDASDLTGTTGADLGWVNDETGLAASELNVVRGYTGDMGPTYPSRTYAYDYVSFANADDSDEGSVSVYYKMPNAFSLPAGTSRVEIDIIGHADTAHNSLMFVGLGSETTPYTMAGFYPSPNKIASWNAREGFVGLADISEAMGNEADTTFEMQIDVDDSGIVGSLEEQYGRSSLQMYANQTGDNDILTYGFGTSGLGNWVTHDAAGEGLPPIEDWDTLWFWVTEWGEDNGIGLVEVYAQGDINTIPEPSALVLCAMGLLGLVFYGRRRRKA